MKKDLASRRLRGRENLSQANKLSRTYAVLLDALNHHRGKGADSDALSLNYAHRRGFLFFMRKCGMPASINSSPYASYPIRA